MAAIAVYRLPKMMIIRASPTVAAKRVHRAIAFIGEFNLYQGGYCVARAGCLVSAGISVLINPHVEVYELM